MLHWPQEIKSYLCPFFAMDHALCLWNHLLIQETGILPFKLFKGQMVFKTMISEKKRLPRNCRGQYLGVAMEHSSTIGCTWHIHTGHVSPQFHVVYDPLFITVPNAKDPNLADVDEINLDSLLDIVSGSGRSSAKGFLTDWSGS
jgi:hypothetical protein